MTKENTLERKNLCQYRSIKELENHSDELLNEWAIYCGMQIDDLIDEIDLNEY
ncbi:7175_t:CDS:2 [Entrophospora sp. SA101]|nr:7175_t:CDS:2 [Entrophospora sp. SA101]